MSMFRRFEFGTSSIRSPKPRPVNRLTTSLSNDKTRSSSSPTIKTPRSVIRRSLAIKSAEKARELEQRLRKKDELDDNGLKIIEDKLESILKKQEAARINEKVEQHMQSLSEELQATLAELEETRNNLCSTERKYSFAMKKISRLETEKEGLQRELQNIEKELIERRRKSLGSGKRILEASHAMNTNSTIILQEDDENLNLEEVFFKNKNEKMTSLEKQVVDLTNRLENERTAHKSLIRDMLTAVKVAESLREEAQHEVTRWRDATRSEEASDQAEWTEIMRKWEGGSKRNALLAWVRSRLTAYPSLSVSNMSSDWSDGRIVCALIHSYRPDLITRMDMLGECKDRALSLFSSLHLPPSSHKIFDSHCPDWRIVLDVTFQLYKCLEKPSEY